MTHEIDWARVPFDKRYAAWVRAKTGAARTAAIQRRSKTTGKFRREPTTQEDEFRGIVKMLEDNTAQRTQQAIDALVNLRRDILIGLPPAALLDRIDDELFKLKRPK